MNSHWKAQIHADIIPGILLKTCYSDLLQPQWPQSLSITHPSGIRCLLITIQWFYSGVLPVIFPNIKCRGLVYRHNYPPVFSLKPNLHWKPLSEILEVSKRWNQLYNPSCGGGCWAHKAFVAQSTLHNKENVYICCIYNWVYMQACLFWFLESIIYGFKYCFTP